MKILVIEDEVSLSDALVKILEKAGHRTDAVYDGETALDYVEDFSYDLLIVDVMLPKMDGFEVVHAVRHLSLKMPILMLTAKATVADKVTGLKTGADDYMTKPFDTEELLARVDALTRRTGDLILNELAFGDLKLDLSSAMLYGQNDSVQLSKKEFEVCKLFFKNHGITITKENLITDVWGYDSEATDNNVEAYISFLRKKFRYLNSKVTIKTIQKIGYRLEVKESA